MIQIKKKFEKVKLPQEAQEIFLVIFKINFSLLKFNLIIVDDGIFQGAGVKSEMLTAN